jgi:hypothetical protein
VPQEMSLVQLLAAAIASYEAGQARRRRLIASLMSVVVMDQAMRSIRNRHYLTRPVLLSPWESAWSRVRDSHDDMAYRTCVGLEYDTFWLLEGAFRPHFEARTKWRPGQLGRPRHLSAADTLSVCLHWLIAPVRGKHLQLIFGATPSTISRALSLGLTSLVGAVRDLPETRIEWPRPEEMALMAALVQAREPDFPNCIGFADGIMLRIPNPPDLPWQNAFYSGYKGYAAVNNVLCFSPLGTIIWTAYNAPGSWHDSRIAYPLYRQILDDKRTPKPFRVVMDSAFVAVRDKIVVPVGPKGVMDLNSSARAANAALIRSRQPAEWGMRAFRGQFNRLSHFMPTDPEERRWILFICMRLFNLRARVEGRGNQISNVFDPEWVASLLHDRSFPLLQRLYPMLPDDDHQIDVNYDLLNRT